MAAAAQDLEAWVEQKLKRRKEGEISREMLVSWFPSQAVKVTSFGNPEAGQATQSLHVTLHL